MLCKLVLWGSIRAFGAIRLKLGHVGRTEENLTKVSLHINCQLIYCIPGSHKVFPLKPYFKNWIELLTLGKKRELGKTGDFLKPQFYQCSKSLIWLSPDETSKGMV